MSEIMSEEQLPVESLEEVAGGNKTGNNSVCRQGSHEFRVKSENTLNGYTWRRYKCTKCEQQKFTCFPAGKPGREKIISERDYQNYYNPFEEIYIV